MENIDEISTAIAEKDNEIDRIKSEYNINDSDVSKAIDVEPVVEESPGEANTEEKTESD